MIFDLTETKREHMDEVSLFGIERWLYSNNLLQIIEAPITQFLIVTEKGSCYRESFLQ